MGAEPSVHASAVLTGAHAVLIRGPAGSGKSQLALALIQAAETGLLRFARLVGDDRLHLEVHHGRLLVRAAGTLAGLIEVRGLGIRRLDYEPVAVVGLVVDLAASVMILARSAGGTDVWRLVAPGAQFPAQGAPAGPALSQCNSVPKPSERPLRTGLGS